MAAGKLTKTATAQMLYGTTVADLKTILVQVPDNAKISVQHYAGDQRDPSYTNLTFSWTD